MSGPPDPSTKPDWSNPMDQAKSTDTPERWAEKHPYFKRLSDDGFVDEIRIRTVPRFKESGLSGDEWRTSGVAELYRKGVLVGRESYHSVTIALAYLARFAGWGGIAPADLKIDGEDLSGDVMNHTDSDFCMQPGCAEPWTVEYRMVKEGCGRCGHVEDIEQIEWKNVRRRFCDRHAKRGDSSLDDSDRNYVRVEA